jgi:hypothetical protein
MKLKHCCLVFVVLALTILGCKKDEAPTSAGDQFVDELTLGTGMSGFSISGEAATFTKDPVSNEASIYWRLECKDDYGNQGARLRIEKLVSGAYQSYKTIDPPVAQNYGHIYVNGPVTVAVGSYKATGIHIGSGRTVAVVDFVVH